MLFNFGICSSGESLVLSRIGIYQGWGLSLFPDGIGLYQFNLKLRQTALLVIADWIERLSTQLGVPVALN